MLFDNFRCSNKEFLVEIDAGDFFLYVFHTIIQYRESLADEFLVGKYTIDVGLQYLNIKWFYDVIVSLGF